jgi:hypothetical protein
MVELVETMLKLHKDLPKAKTSRERGSGRPGAATLLLAAGWILLSGVLLAQDQRWVYTYDGGAGDKLNCIVCDAANNTYSAGGSYSHYDDFLVVSTTPDGVERWTYRYNGSADLWDDAYAIASDGGSRVYAAGTSSGSGTAEDFTVVALDTAGTEQWVYRYNGRVNSFDVAYCVACDEDGNVYAAGVCDSNSQLVVISLTPGGTRRWVYKYDGPGSISNCGRAIVCGRDGNVYVAGFGVGNGTWEDFTVLSLTAAGQERWVYARNGSANWSRDEARSIACDSTGNVYAAGWCEDSISAEDIVVVSLDSAGHERWAYQLVGPAGKDDEALSLALGAGGTTYAAGYAGDTGGYTVLVTVALDDSGRQKWVYRHDRGPYNSEKAGCITAATAGDIYVAGVTCPTGWDDDFTILSLSADGDLRWTYHYDGPESTDDQANYVTVGDDGFVYAAGTSPVTEGDGVVVSVMTGVGTDEKASDVPGSVCALRSHPAPFANHVTIEYSLPSSSPVMLAVFDASGRLVRALEQEWKAAGVYVVPWDGSDERGKAVCTGAYLCRLTAGTSPARTAKLLRTARH